VYQHSEYRWQGWLGSVKQDRSDDIDEVFMSDLSL